MFFCGVVIIFAGLVYSVIKEIPYIFVASQSGGFVNRLERLFVVGGFRVVCI